MITPQTNIEYVKDLLKIKKINNKTAKINAKLLKEKDEIERELQATRYELLRKIKK